MQYLNQINLPSISIEKIVVRLNLHYLYGKAKRIGKFLMEDNPEKPKVKFHLWDKFRTKDLRTMLHAKLTCNLPDKAFSKMKTVSVKIFR
jgi:hypothetical protein